MNQTYQFVNPPLPYSYNALEPFIDEKTMMLHHDRHLQTYIDNLNKILSSFPEYQNLSLEELLCHASHMPCFIQTEILHNAGGVFNHIFFFQGMTNPSQQSDCKPLSDQINFYYGTFQNFQEKFTQAALSVFGSGYAWLVQDACCNLRIITTPNQETPIVRNMCPILCIDVWEHSYYLKHYNKRADYIQDWFHVINWEYACSLL